MIERAKGLLQQALEILEPEIIAGTPVVVLEPSCASVFRDELLNLFPDNEWAQRLSSQVFLLSEFLERQASQFSFPQVTANALVHGHCHHKSLMKMTDEEAVLRRLGIKYSMPAPGCCGMAGAFGFEKDTCDVSLAIGELELLPAVRRTPSDWLIIADGFSCREQIEQCTGRKTRHLAEVIRAGLREATKNS
jgi:Fe-S oxidoreductase